MEVFNSALLAARAVPEAATIVKTAADRVRAATRHGPGRSDRT
jgi:hypothetical protein